MQVRGSCNAFGVQLSGLGQLHSVRQLQNTAPAHLHKQQQTDPTTRICNSSSRCVCVCVCRGRGGSVQHNASAVPVLQCISLTASLIGWTSEVFPMFINHFLLRTSGSETLTSSLPKPSMHKVLLTSEREAQTCLSHPLREAPIKMVT